MMMMNKTDTIGIPWKYGQQPGFECEEFQLAIDNMLLFSYGYLKFYYDSKENNLIISVEYAMKSNYSSLSSLLLEEKEFIIEIKWTSKIFLPDPYHIDLWNGKQRKQLNFEPQWWINNGGEHMIIRKGKNQQITLFTKPVPEQFKSNRIWLFEFFGNDENNNNGKSMKRSGQLCENESGDNGKLLLSFTNDEPCNHFPYVTIVADIVLIYEKYLYIFFPKHVEILTNWHSCNPFHTMVKQCEIDYKEVSYEDFFICRPPDSFDDDCYHSN